MTDQMDNQQLQAIADKWRKEQLKAGNKGAARALVMINNGEVVDSVRALPHGNQVEPGTYAIEWDCCKYKSDGSQWVPVDKEVRRREPMVA